MSTNDKTRRLKFEIFRYNPQDKNSEPHMDVFEIDEAPFMTLFIALNQIREKHDPGLQFDFACRSAICGSCGMMVNGRPALACRTLTTDLPEKVQLYPLPTFKLIGDLSVDTGTWFREMAEKTEAWIHERLPFDPEATEERMNDDIAAAIYEGDRCIECGCCVASCGLANLDSDFLAGAGLNRVARFMMDPRDARTDADWFDVVAGEHGAYACIGLMACADVCPKELPLLDVYAYLRRKSLSAAFSDDQK